MPSSPSSVRILTRLYSRAVTCRRAKAVACLSGIRTVLAWIEMIFAIRVPSDPAGAACYVNAYIGRLRLSTVLVKPRGRLPLASAHRGQEGNNRKSTRPQQPRRRSPGSDLDRQSGQHLVESHRIVAHPDPARVVDRVDQRRTGPADAQFADALALQRIGLVIEFREEDRVELADIGMDWNVIFGQVPIDIGTEAGVEVQRL